MTKDQAECFIDATCKTLGGMLHTKVEPTEVSQEDAVSAGFDVSGIVGLSGQLHGAVVLSQSESVARRAVGRILGVGEMPTLDQDVADGIGEMVNVIVGAAKRGLADHGIQSCTASLPTVILGAQHRVFRLRDVHCRAATFESEIGTFMLQVYVRSQGDAPTGKPL
ncbi:chemotaxis protein CheX [Planctomycetota bacterium]